MSVARKKILTEEEVAKILLVSAASIARWRRQGIIRHYRQIGRLIRYTPEDVENIIADRAAARPKVVISSPVTEARFG